MLHIEDGGLEVRLMRFGLRKAIVRFHLKGNNLI
jgi:hypothetical protein